MPTYNIRFYDVDPFGILSQTAGNTAVWTGTTIPDGTGTITDNGAGIEGERLDSNPDETATLTSDIGGSTSSNDPIYAGEVWTVRDTVTGTEFQVISMRITTGPNTGWATLSEVPLVNGRSYETLSFNNTPDAADPTQSFTYDDYVEFAATDVVQGTSGNDVIDVDYEGDPDGDKIDQGDTVTPLQFNWTDYADEQDLRSNTPVNLDQDAGGITVALDYDDPNTADEFSAETTETIFVAAGEGFSNSSAGYMRQAGEDDPTVLTFSFSANAGSGFEDGVQNVRFRISDIDGLVQTGVNFRDIVQVQAFDANGNPVTVDITGGSNHTVDPATGTITGSLQNGSPAAASGSALIEIAGPVSSIRVTYDNGGNTAQAIYFSDILFDAVDTGGFDDTVEAGEGDDIITAGVGADTVFGGTGNDTINTGTGDTSFGEEGDDTFVIDTDQLDGTGTLSVDGGAEGGTDTDTLNFSGQLLYGSLVKNADVDDTGAFSGSATLLDGTTVTFDNIENVLCFADGMLIDTPHGPRPVQDLAPGDPVLTRDSGPQEVRWHGTRHVMASADVAPIEIAAGAFGNARALRVSPQHRILCAGPMAELYFGHREVLVAALHLVNGTSVRQLAPGPVTYHHILFEQHEIISSGGIESESYHPGSYSLPGLDPEAREALFALLPQLRTDPGSFGASARYSVKGAMAHLLAA